MASPQKMAATVRLATEADAAALIELRRKLFSETSFMLWEPAEFTQTAEQERARIARLNSQPNSLVLLAEQGTQAVGLLSAVGGERNRLRHAAALALGVARSHWGQGVATAMVREAVAWSARIGLKRLELTVHTSNLAAVSVYLRCGFQVEGVRRSSLFVEGAYVDEYLMSLLHG
ncbi:MAG: family acetyltransferase [Ramlibacter sp.]|nr:family acetyltransferase [Ramlibacter sp.]